MSVSGTESSATRSKGKAMNTAFETWFDGNFSVAKNGTVRDRGNRKTTAEKISAAWSGMQNSIVGWEFVSAADVQKYISGAVMSANELEDEEEKVPPRTWIMAKLDQARRADGQKEAGYWFSDDFKEIRHKVNGGTMAASIEDVYHWLVEMNATERMGFDCGVIKSTLFNIAKEIHTGTVGEIKAAITYDPEKEELLNKFLVFFKQEFGIRQKQEIIDTVMKHWMWMAKRRLLGLPVVDHIMVNLYGGTDLGKTKFEENFTTPFRNYVVPQMTFAKLIDSTREVKKLTENFILLFEELAINVADEGHATFSKDNLNTVKAVLTGEKVQTRVMGTQNQQTSRVSFVCIGSSNTHLYDTPLFDDTTMRRYFEFDCERDKRVQADYDRMDAWLANACDIWKGIDETLEKGYLKRSPVFDEIRSIQKSYYPTKSTTYDWIQWKVDGPGGNDKLRRIGEQAYKLYNKWCRDTGRIPRNMPNWVKDIQHIAPDLVTEDGVVNVKLKLHTLV